MVKLPLSIALGDYDRVRPLFNGSVQIDGCDPVFMLLEPEEIFFRAFRQEAFDVCELSLSTFALRTAQGDNPYVGVPVFPSRAFRHTAIYVRSDRGIEQPEDLRGARIGVPEYQLTANVWARSILWDDFGVAPSAIDWVQGGLEQPGRVEKAAIRLPPGVRLTPAPSDACLSDMLANGDLDGVITPRAPSCFLKSPKVRWLFKDPTTAASDWHRRTQIFPIMHVLGVRRAMVEKHPWLPVACQKAFERAKSLALAQLEQPAAPKVSLPFIEEQLVAAKALLGEDYWPYGMAKNAHVVDAFLDTHYRQGLSGRRLLPEELFHASTHEIGIV